MTDGGWYSLGMQKGKLYLIGGSARSGKTIILNELIRRKPMLALSTDALREGVRNIFAGESYLDIQKLHFKGELTFRRAREKEILIKKFEQRPSESEITWQATIGFIDHYDRKNISIAIEGLAITPERVKSLQLKNLELKVVFIGFTKVVHLEKILEHSQKYNDWINKVIEDDGGSKTKIEEWFKKTIRENKRLSKQVREYGYYFIDISEDLFEKNIQSGIEYLLK